MDRELKLVFQEIHDAVATHSKLAATRRLTCMRAYSPVLSAVVKVVHLNLDTVITQGRGLHWFAPDGQNSIFLNLQGADALPPESVKVHFSRLGAEMVDVRSLGGGTVEILYRADSDDALGLTVSVYDQIVSESIAQQTVSPVFPASTVLSHLSVGRNIDVKFIEWLPNKKMRLLFRLRRDGASAFHRLCDDQGPTVTLIKSSGWYVFGGYAGLAWSSDYEDYECPSAFLFTVTNPHGDPITRFMSNGDNYAVICYSGRGPSFGRGDLCVSPTFDDHSYTYFPRSYIDTLGRGEVTFAGGRDFTPAEVEVWAVE